ncbi:transposase [Burkholderia ambifaria]
MQHGCLGRRRFSCGATRRYATPRSPNARRDGRPAGRRRSRRPATVTLDFLPCLAGRRDADPRDRGRRLYEPDPADVALLRYRRGDVQRAVDEVVAQFGV